MIILTVRRLMISHLIIKQRINFAEKFKTNIKNFEWGGEETVNNKWMESGFMLIQQVAHLAKYQTLKEMESCGLKPNQAGILVVLRSEGGLSQKELAKRMGVTPPSMTAALKKMEKQGYVLCLNGLQHMMRNLEKRLYEGISAEERQEMKETLLKMRENVLRYKEFQGMDMCEIMEKTRPPKMPEKSI